MAHVDNEQQEGTHGYMLILYNEINYLKLNIFLAAIHKLCHMILGNFTPWFTPGETQFFLISSENVRN